jgi:hypothetical protein
MREPLVAYTSRRLKASQMASRVFSWGQLQKHRQKELSSRQFHADHQTIRNLGLFLDATIKLGSTYAYKFAQRSAITRRGAGNAFDVVVNIEIGILYPHGMVQSQRRLS